MRRTIPILCVVGLLALSACGNGDEGSGEATGQDQMASPTAGLLAGMIPVVGITTCERELVSHKYAKDGSEVYRETFTCDTVMSDPRASGREVLHLETIFLKPEDVTAAFTGPGTLTNDEGKWTGTWEGAVGLEWVNYNKSEVSYVGQGAYEGLTLRLLAAGRNAQMYYAGWIEPSE